MANEAKIAQGTYAIKITSKDRKCHAAEWQRVSDKAGRLWAKLEQTRWRAVYQLPRGVP
jgi:hypothetical protein